VNGEPSSLISPGLWGFVAFFVLAIALYLLMRNMNARMRRMSYRSEELQREAEAEAAERRERKAGGSTPATRDDSPQAGDGDDRKGQTEGTH
jgi:flagellar biosynthesis/type III secretory pathway M-ring protein FliF/YscJ